MVSHETVETRLTKIGGQRLARLHVKDLPRLARALVAVIRKRAYAKAHVSRNVPFVRIKSNEHDVLVMKEDWALIMPYIQGDIFNPMMVPRASRVGYLDVSIAYGEPVEDHADKNLYDAILGILQQLFTDRFPTSDL